MIRIYVAPGFRMLAKMGFKAGSGLGRNEEGIAAPLVIATTAGKVGTHFNKRQTMTVDLDRKSAGKRMIKRAAILLGGNSL